MPTKAERSAGAPPLPKFQRFYGRVYVNEGVVIHSAVEAGIPTSFIDTTWGSSGRGLRKSDESFHFFRLLRRLPSMARIGMSQARQQPRTPKQKEQKVPNVSGEKLFMEVDQWVDQFQQQDMQQLDDRALWRRWIPLWIKRGKAMRSVFVTAVLAAVLQRGSGLAGPGRARRPHRLRFGQQWRRHRHHSRARHELHRHGAAARRFDRVALRCLHRRGRAGALEHGTNTARLPP